jgi:hypothetical protein
MTEDRPPEVMMVPVERHDVNLTFDDLLTPLADSTDETIIARGLAPESPALARLAELRSLAGRLRDLGREIDQLDPTVLRSGDSEPAS